MSSELARLMLPVIRWDRALGYDEELPRIERALALGVGGFILFGGTREGVSTLTRSLRARSAFPLLIGADLERGAGQQFEGATGLPPLAAIASLRDLAAIRKAAAITAREASTVGVNWIFAPVCDVDLEPDNPIIGTRAFGSDVEWVAECAAEWVDACQAEGVLSSAKHFPGHGRTRADSHAELPVVHASVNDLYAGDLAPFRAAIDAGVASVMTAHVSFPALDSSGAPATLSRPIVDTLLRGELGFDGMVVTDALIMAGVLAAGGGGEEEACVRALSAGCDLLLYPDAPAKVLAALEQAVSTGALDAERLRASLQRRKRWAEWAGPARASAEVLFAAHRRWADALADRVVHVVSGSPLRTTPPIDVVIVDDDIGGPYPPPSRQPFIEEIRAFAGEDVRVVEAPGGDGRRSLVVALFGDIRAWKGRPGYSASSLDSVRRVCEFAPETTVIQFGHPRLAGMLVGTRNVVSAWGGEEVMQRAAARWLFREPA